MNAAVLELGMYPELEERAPYARGGAAGKVLAGLAVIALIATALLIDAFGLAARLQAMAFGPAEVAAAPAPVTAEKVAAMNVDDKSQLLAEGEDAQARNAEIPLAGLPLEQVSQFSLAGAPATYANALKCLTQAVYYEAAVEPLQGRRAVAQVVLNRVRHPAYPNSVCGVVYQGSERRTGCQFSFTCDGSLLRAPAAGPWREAAEVAKAALAGYVERSVGTATHYHADYVLPKWAFELGKIGQIGRHIFYRFQGGYGTARAFTDRYNAAEFIPALNVEALEARLAELAALPVEEQLVPGLTVTPHVTDRHAETDVGGRIDTTKEWRLSIPDPVQASARYRQALGEDTAPAATAAVVPEKAAADLAAADGVKPAAAP